MRAEGKGSVFRPGSTLQPKGTPMAEAKRHYTTRSLLLVDLTLFLAAGLLGTFAIACIV